MPEVRLHRAAEQEAAEAADWYEDQHPGLGDQFLTEVERAMEAIAESPRTWPIWQGTSPDSGIHRFLLARFPYGIAYIVEEGPVIIAVAHLHRRPLYWQDRLGR